MAQGYASVSSVTRSLRTGESVMPPQAVDQLALAKVQAEQVARAVAKPRKARKGA
ncbi:hypothetical protein D3C84_953230 [compost metagenome]